MYSSPPFFNWERYSTSREQSYKRYENYEQWRSEFLTPIIAQSVRILSTKGYLILNVTGGNRLPTPHMRKWISDFEDSAPASGADRFDSDPRSRGKTLRAIAASAPETI